MDTFARGLLCASKLLDDGILPALVQERYSSFDKGIGAKIEKGTTNFEELEVCTIKFWCMLSTSCDQILQIYINLVQLHRCFYGENIIKNACFFGHNLHAKGASRH